MQTVRLGIDRDPVDGPQVREELGQLGISCNHRRKLQAPSSNIQRSTKLQISTNLQQRHVIALPCLMFGISLELGVWSLELFLSSQSAQEQLRVCLLRVQLIDQLFHRLNRRQRGHRFPQEL